MDCLEFLYEFIDKLAPYLGSALVAWVTAAVTPHMTYALELKKDERAKRATCYEETLEFIGRARNNPEVTVEIEYIEGLYHQRTEIRLYGSDKFYGIFRELANKWNSERLAYVAEEEEIRRSFFEVRAFQEDPDSPPVYSEVLTRGEYTDYESAVQNAKEKHLLSSREIDEKLSELERVARDELSQ